MDRRLRILLVEESEDDTALLIRELQRAGYRPTVQRVETAEAMNAALDAEDWDIVLADYVLPRFSALAALVVLKKRGLDLPFIIASGAISEGIAVAATKAGAHDYVMKDNIGRLGEALDRALREGAQRRQRRQTGELRRVT